MSVLGDDDAPSLTQVSRRDDGAAAAASAGGIPDFVITDASVRDTAYLRATPLNDPSRRAPTGTAWSQLKREALFNLKTTAMESTGSGSRRAATTTTFEAAFAALTARSLCRGQGAIGTPPVVWEKSETGTNVAFNYTFFPVVGRVSTGDGKGRPKWTSYLYCALYSQVVPSSGRGDDSVLQHVPSWTPIQTTGDDGGEINVDMSHIGDQNAWLAIYAALQNSRAQKGYYLSFFPVVGAEHFQSRIDRDGRHAWAVRGPSLGLAVAMAIVGGSPVMYTGYLKALFPNGTTDDQLAKTTGVDYRAPRDSSGQVLPYPTQGARVLSGQIASYNTTEQRYGPDPFRYGAVGTALSTIMENLNYVETVHFLPQKVLLALTIAMPIVIPYYNSMGEKMESFIRSRNFQQTAFLIKMHSKTFTCADAQDGRSVTALAPNVFIAATLAEATILGAFAATVYYSINGFSGVDRDTYADDAAQSASATGAPAAEAQRALMTQREAVAQAKARAEAATVKGFKEKDDTAGLQQFFSAKVAAMEERRIAQTTAAAQRKLLKKQASLRATTVARRAKIAKMQAKYKPGEKKALFGAPKPSIRQTAARALLGKQVTASGLQKRTTRTAKQLAAEFMPGETAQEKAQKKAIDARMKRHQAEMARLFGADGAPSDAAAAAVAADAAMSGDK